MPRGNGKDPLVVPTAALAEVLQEWIASWLRDRPFSTFENTKHNKSDNTPVAYMSPQTWLSEKTGYDKKVFRQIFNRDAKYTSLHRADTIITAIDATHLLGSRIPIVANPHWTQEKWIAWLAERGCEPHEIISD